MSTAAFSGRIKHLRVNDSAYNEPFGPPGDTLTTQVIVVLDSSDKFFGFDVKPGPHLPSRLAMLSVLRDAYVNDLTIGFLGSFEDGKKACTILRIDLERP